MIPVQAYFEPILCWFLGHSKRACRGREKCVTCGLTHIGECTAPSFCVNCKGAHRSNDKKCPEFLKRKDLAKAKALKTVPMKEVQPTSSCAGSFNIFSDIAFPRLPPKKLFQETAVPEVNPELIGSKRPRVEPTNNISSFKITASPTVIIEEITNKIIEDISLEKAFFSSMFDEVKSSDINGDELVICFTNKIREMLKPNSEETVVLMDTVPPKRS